ncbi:hypothetical protein ACPC54_09830 [Kitasatospora sp. NPDC094028]
MSVIVGEVEQSVSAVELAGLPLLALALDDFLSAGTFCGVSPGRATVVVGFVGVSSGQAVTAA